MKNGNPTYLEYDAQRRHQKILEKLGNEEYRGQISHLYGRRRALLEVILGGKKHS
jgi:hypothetical protein